MITDVSPELQQSKGFPDGLDGKESAFNASDPGSIPGSGRSPGNEEMTTHSSILAGEFLGQRSLAGYVQPMGSQRIGHS